MRKIFFSLLCLFSLFPLSKSQTVDSIKVKQAGGIFAVMVNGIEAKVSA